MSERTGGTGGRVGTIDAVHVGRPLALRHAAAAGEPAARAGW